MVSHCISQRQEEEDRQWALRLEINRRTKRLAALAAEREAASKPNAGKLF